MHILLTGAAGFIGAKVAEQLLDAGHEVLGVDNLNDYYDVRLKEHRLDALRPRPNFQFAAVDVEDRDALAACVGDRPLAGIVNLAARAGVRASIDEPRVYATTNVLGTLNLLQLAVERGVRRFVLASTSSLYAGTPMPFVESADVTRPISPYAATKLGAEALAHAWHHLYGLHTAIVRYFTVYGPAGRPDMSPFRFIERIRRGLPITVFGDGRQTRDFTYVDDVARGTVLALGHEGFDVINIGGGRTPRSLNEMIEIIERELGVQARIDYQARHSADMPDTAAAIDKAERLLAWRPEIDLAEGLRRTVQWHRTNAGWLDGVGV